jgi:lipoprotein-releasing system ATP-binding protein
MDPASGNGERAGLLVRGLRKVFPGPGGEIVVLDGVDLELPPAGTLAIVGPSGCGKSTLLHILGTLDRPSAGSVLLDGVDPFALQERELARLRNRKIGFVFQDHHLLPQLTALENVLMPALAGRDGLPGAETVEARAERLLESVGLASRRHHLPGELSGGERQRVAIARALLLRPRLVLADEPTGNLDRAAAENVAERLLALRSEEGAQLIVVTHSRALAERFERRATLDGGRMRFEGGEDARRP